jgi:dethiobiotin synthetase
VGKTVIAAALVKALRERGVRALGFKPVETGVDGVEPADSDLLQRASDDATALAAPLLRLAEPLAPAVAAARTGTPICAGAIEQQVERLRREGYTLVVEGAGGALVPLSWEKVPGTFFGDPPEKGSRNLFPYYTILDLAERCGLEAIVVGRAGLGTLNHIALTVAALRARMIPIKAVILNGGQPWPSADLAEATNPDALARMLSGARIIYIPRHDGADVIDAAVPYLRTLYP